MFIALQPQKKRELSMTALLIHFYEDYLITSLAVVLDPLFIILR